MCIYSFLDFEWLLTLCQLWSLHTAEQGNGTTHLVSHLQVPSFLHFEQTFLSLSWLCTLYYLSALGLSICCRLCTEGIQFIVCRTVGAIRTQPGHAQRKEKNIHRVRRWLGWGTMPTSFHVVPVGEEAAFSLPLSAASPITCGVCLQMQAALLHQLCTGLQSQPPQMEHWMKMIASVNKWAIFLPLCLPSLWRFL
jgi:hypothetical protein